MRLCSDELSFQQKQNFFSSLASSLFCCIFFLFFTVKANIHLMFRHAQASTTISWSVTGDRMRLGHHSEQQTLKTNWQTFAKTLSMTLLTWHSLWLYFIRKTKVCIHEGVCTFHLSWDSRSGARFWKLVLVDNFWILIVQVFKVTPSPWHRLIPSLGRG